MFRCGNSRRWVKKPMGVPLRAVPSWPRESQWETIGEGEMRQFSRRTLLRSSAVLRSSAIMAAPLFPARGEPGLNRNLLTKAWPMERVAKVLIPRESFRPFPAAGERGAWEALPADARAALVQSTEKHLKTPWDALPATLALE